MAISLIFAPLWQKVLPSLLTAGPARFTQSIKILYAPNSSAAGAVMQRFAQAAACPPDPDKKVGLLEMDSACWDSKPICRRVPTARWYVVVRRWRGAFLHTVQMQDKCPKL